MKEYRIYIPASELDKGVHCALCRPQSRASLPRDLRTFKNKKCARCGQSDSDYLCVDCHRYVCVKCHLHEDDPKKLEAKKYPFPVAPKCPFCFSFQVVSPDFLVKRVPKS